MSRVVFGNKVATRTQPIDDATMKCIADCLGISDTEFKLLMADNPSAVYLYRGRDARKNQSGGGGGGGGGGSMT